MASKCGRLGGPSAATSSAVIASPRTATPDKASRACRSPRAREAPGLLGQKLVINDLRPRLHRLAHSGQRGARVPGTALLFRFEDRHRRRAGVEQEPRAEVDAALFCRLVVQDAGKRQVVVAGNVDFFGKLFLEPRHEVVARIDMATDAERQ